MYSDTLFDKNYLKNITTYINMTNSKYPNKNRNDKISELDFEILSFHQYENIVKYNYNVKQMRIIAKYYKLKVSGNKNELKHRLYNYLKQSFYVNIIQKWTRRYFVKCLLYYKGPALYNRSLCNNNSDFYTLENINNIPFMQFISYKDCDNFIYGFDLSSLSEYIRSNNDANNPYNRNKFPSDIKVKIMKIKILSKILDIGLKNTIIRENVLANSDSYYEDINIREKSVELFLKMDEFGHITNINWFSELSHVRLIRFLRELYDIWSYRAQLTRTIQLQIVNPTGNPFHTLMYRDAQNLTFQQLQKYVLRTMENFITKGINQESQGLGVFYVLSALTLVSSDAAQSMPWLYQSVQHM